MDQEILQLVRSLSHRGLKGLDVQHKRMLLWNRAIKTWNKEHEPAAMGLADVQKAFVKVWPAIYGGYVEIGNNLYLSVSYMDFFFEPTDDGFVKGGLFIRDEKTPMPVLCMTADKLAELALRLAAIPMSVSEMDKCEKEIEDKDDCISARLKYFAENDNSKQPDSFWLGQIALDHLHKAMNFYYMNMFVEALAEFEHVIYYMKISQVSAADKGVTVNPELSMAFPDSYAYTMMGVVLFYLYRWKEAKLCFQLAYSGCLKLYEPSNWIDLMNPGLDEEEKASTEQHDRGQYLEWAWYYGNFLFDTHEIDQAVLVLLNARAVAVEMNTIEEGKWQGWIDDYDRLLSAKASITPKSV